MKTSILKIQIAALCMAMLTSSVTAQETKEIRKDFPVNQGTRLEIFNKYGNVDVVNREDAAITIKVVVKVNGRDKEKSDELLKMVDINISQEGDVIKAETNLDEDFGRYFKGFNSNDGLEINYTVSIPKTLPLNLSNKYGNVFVDQLTGTSTIDVKYGKLTANKIVHDSKQPLSKVYLSYSNASIQDARWIEIDMKYSKLNITDSRALAVLSKYSKLYVTNGSSIVSESKYDTYEFGKLTNFVTNAAYGHFNISSLSGKLQTDTKYTDVIIDAIPAGFESIKVSNSYGSYKLGIDPAASYKINANARYCNINYPEGNARVSRFNENNQQRVNGVVGTNQNPKADVTITTSYGNIRLVN
jgi:hypothetical protein